MEMNQTELNKILKKHKKWLNGEAGGERAILREVDLRGWDLSNSDLRYIVLRGCDLSGCDLSNSDLRYIVLRGCDLSGCDLSNSDLRYSKLRNSNLRGCNLRGCVLNRSDLIGCKNVPFIPYACPEVGSFIGYKKASGFIVELEIPADARRCSATTRKCRCDKAKVLRILHTSRSVSKITAVASDHDEGFIYRIGEEVKVADFCEDRWNECSAGIHFFISFQEAVEY